MTVKNNIYFRMNRPHTKLCQLQDPVNKSYQWFCGEPGGRWRGEATEADTAATVEMIERNGGSDIEIVPMVIQ